MNMRSDLLNEAVCPQVGWEWTYRNQGQLGILAFLFDLEAFSMILCSSLHYHLPHIKPRNLGCCVGPGQGRERTIPDLPSRLKLTPRTIQNDQELGSQPHWLVWMDCFLTLDLVAINCYKIYCSNSQILLRFLTLLGTLYLKLLLCFLLPSPPKL